jgi:hypothetical protein
MRNAEGPRRFGAGRLAPVAALLMLWGPSAQGHGFPVPGIPWAPRQYVCYRSGTPLQIDGALAEEDWQRAAWTEPFVDIEGEEKPKPRFLTRAKMLWDDSSLYVACEMEEPDVWATLTSRDAVIFHDNDFEVFIDPDGDTHEYYELEINALGTEWDLLLIRPYRDGGPAVDSWDIQGLRTATLVDGTLNDPADTDGGWTVEIAIPWTVLEECARRPSPPAPGDRWRVNFSRVEWRTGKTGEGYAKLTDPATGEPLPEDNWVWSPQGLVNMHYPEMWGFVQFSSILVGEGTEEPASRIEEAASWALRKAYYAERRRFSERGTYTSDRDELRFHGISLAGRFWSPTITAMPRLFEARIEIPGGDTLYIREDGRVRTGSDQ